MGGGRLRTRGCAFEVLMVDDRPWKRLALPGAPYWVVSAALNYAYAERFGYGFRVVRPAVPAGTPGEQPGPSAEGLGAPVYPGWNKVMYLAERLRAAAAQEACTWILYLDSDAFVRQADLPLPVFLRSLAARYGLAERVSAILAREEEVPGANLSNAALSGAAPEAPFLNTGVVLVRAGGSDGGADGGARALFDAWLAAAAGVGHRRLWTTWPGEQGVLAELVRPGTYPGAATAVRRARGLRPTVGVVNATEMNSPWGRFVQHCWGKGATDALVRERALMDALVRLGAGDRRTFARLRAAAARLVEPWTPWGHF